MIKLKSVTMQNFKAIGNSPITITLNENKTTLITGKNGSGKSTVLDAICFGLFGRAYSQVNKPGLINSINQKKCLVTVEFDVGSVSYKVSRGIKPNVFDIYQGEVLRNKSAEAKDDQKYLEQQILKLNFKSFIQVMIMGSNYIPFMRLPALARREFIEDLLDIRIFSIMNKMVSEKTKALKEESFVVETESRTTKEKVKMQDSFVKKLESDGAANISSQQSEIDSLIENNTKSLAEVLVCEDRIKKLNAQLSGFSSLDEDISDARVSIRHANKEKDLIEEKLGFFGSLTDCPTCGQSVSSDVVESLSHGELEKAKKLSSKIYQLSSSLENMTEEQKKKTAILSSITEEQRKVANLQHLVEVNEDLIEKRRLSIKEKKADTSDIQAEKLKLRNYAKQVVALDVKKKEISEQQQYYNLAAMMLHDTGIKAKIIKQYIPSINKMINNYLDELDFFVSFHLDENFNETVKSRHRDEFTYESFSEGQKLRIDLALTFAFREIARLKNSISINLLMLDETDGPLDEEGAMLMYALLGKISAENIFVISHKQNMADKFDKHIEFELKNNFTVMKE